MSNNYKAMGLRECAQYDHQNGLAAKLTGWGIICKDRHDRGVSRKQRRLRAAAQKQEAAQ